MLGQPLPGSETQRWIKWVSGPQGAESLVRDANTPAMGSHGGNSSDGKHQRSPEGMQRPANPWAGWGEPEWGGSGEKALLEGRASQRSL